MDERAHFVKAHNEYLTPPSTYMQEEPDFMDFDSLAEAAINCFMYAVEMTLDEFLDALRIDLLARIEAHQ